MNYLSYPLRVIGNVNKIGNEGAWAPLACSTVQRPEG
jgi:hypothetical protein